MRIIRVALVFLIFSLAAKGQEIKKHFDPEAIDSARFQYLLSEYGNNKDLPERYEKQALIALSYFPELKDIHIIFTFKNNKSPLLSRPKYIHALFVKPEKRTYFIEISNKPEAYLEHTLFANLSFNAQIGVLGHELSHICEFINLKGIQMFGLAVKTLSGKHVDRVEFETDKKTIDHGLGYQLLSWSLEVRMARNVEEWKRRKESIARNMGWYFRERYMDPDTIVELIDNHPKYQDVKVKL